MEIPTNQKQTALILRPSEKTLIDQLRAIPFGEVVIHMRKGQPFKIEVIRESVMLDVQAS